MKPEGAYIGSCEDCKEVFCVDCLTECEDCGKSVCSAYEKEEPCAKQCDGCETTLLCEDCLTECSCCDNKLCGDCPKEYYPHENICPECFDRMNDPHCHWR